MRKIVKCYNMVNGVPCQHQDYIENMIKVPTVSGGAFRYICPECARIKNYFTDNLTSIHKRTKRGVQIGFELECIPNDETAQNMLVNKIYQFIPSYDGSLPPDGVEYKTPVYHNLSGLKSLLRTCEKLVDFHHPDCGQHINVSLDYMTLDDWEAIYYKKYELFNPLIAHMESHRDDLRRVCGRDFNRYARPTLDGGHYSCIAIKDINSIKDARIEFRASKLQDKNQYLQLAEMYLQMIECIYNNFCKYKDARCGVYQHKTQLTANKLIRIFDKFASGKDYSQDPCRNKEY